jgi:hypothetical protein
MDEWVEESLFAIERDAMHEFLQRHEKDVIGMLSGFDRVRLRGTLRFVATTRGMEAYLWRAKVLLKDFVEYAKGVTEQIRGASRALAEAAGRPLVYVASSALRKEQKARQIMAADGVTAGLICILSCVEPCWSYTVRRNREKQQLELHGDYYKCLHHYFYFADPVHGFMHLRLQTWFPFTVHVCINGREWLAQQLRAAGIGYVQRANCIVDVADVGRAQALLTEQVHQPWTPWLNALLARVHPCHAEIFRAVPVAYYWSTEESEWASDVLFRSRDRLARLYPTLLTHGLHNFGSREVLRFLGQKVALHPNPNFKGEVSSRFRARPEGVCLKHWLKRNSIKMYDKQGTVLRVETTINDARDLREYRTAERGPRSKKYWRPLRKGVSAVRRRAALSQAANERYLSALSAVDTPIRLADLSAKHAQPQRWRGKRVRALNLLGATDAALLHAVSRGEFTIKGLRNRDLRALLHSPAASAPERRRQAARVTRQLRLLRAHGLIRKIPKTHRYLLTTHGRQLSCAILAARRANTAELTKLAA